MKQLWMTLQERRLTFLLRWWVGIFTGAMVLFAVFPADIIYWLNAIGHAIFSWPYKSLDLPVEHFWQVLAVSLLAVLVAIAFIAQSDIRQNLGYVRLIIISKIVTVVGFLVAFIFSGPYFAYFVGMIADATVLVLTWYAYHSTVVCRPSSL